MKNYILLLSLFLAAAPAFALSHIQTQTTKLCRPTTPSKTLTPYLVSYGMYGVPSAGTNTQPNTEFQIRFQVIALANQPNDEGVVRGFPTGSVFNDPSTYYINENGKNLTIKASAPCVSAKVTYTCSFNLNINDDKTNLDVNYYAASLYDYKTTATYTTNGNQNNYTCLDVPSNTWFAGMDWSCIWTGQQCVLSIP